MRAARARTTIAGSPRTFSQETRPGGPGDPPTTARSRPASHRRRRTTDRRGRRRAARTRRARAFSLYHHQCRGPPRRRARPPLLAPRAPPSVKPPRASTRATFVAAPRRRAPSAPRTAPRRPRPHLRKRGSALTWKRRPAVPPAAGAGPRPSASRRRRPPVTFWPGPRRCAGPTTQQRPAGRCARGPLLIMFRETPLLHPEPLSRKPSARPLAPRGRRRPGPGRLRDPTRRGRLAVD
mmetsp:Transcript_15056/g.39785  ORF Transcript_15056/g.39785 Transcript_15056/m.39785 type:complete len:237 (-) Transcript_15056:1521-2231(-)